MASISGVLEEDAGVSPSGRSFSWLPSGALGACLGMVVWNHKTSHKRFRYLVPVFVLLQGLLAFYFLRLY